MTTYEEYRHPYELTIRWRNGVPAGIQLECETGVLKDGVLIPGSAASTPAEELDIASFKLNDLMDQTLVDALQNINRLSAEVEASVFKVQDLEQALAENTKDMDAMNEELAKKQAEIIDLQARIAAMEAANGGPADG